jgi:pyruvate ferredoxin oxidoreductase alpha subunit
MAVKSQRLMITGNYAAAYGAKLARPDVIPIYPITPQTSMVEKICEFINQGELIAKFVPVESEHSALTVAISAQAVGARTFTASSSQGMAYMYENLFVASGLRLPIVISIVNRGLAMPISILPDQGDSLGGRDAGWIQYYAANAQEVLDLIIQAYRVAEDPRVLLPAAICFEGFLISHFTEPVDIPQQGDVDAFLPEYHPEHVILDPSRPMHIGILVNELYYTEYRYQQKVGMDNALQVIREVAGEFHQRWGRGGTGPIEPYMMDDAELAVVAMGALSGPARIAIRQLRDEGVKAGLLRLTLFRPFPKDLLCHHTQNADVCIVLDRNVSLGSTGILYGEIASALVNQGHPTKIYNYILGLGGRDVDPGNLKDLMMQTYRDYEDGKTVDAVTWVGVRGL